MTIQDKAQAKAKEKSVKLFRRGGTEMPVWQQSFELLVPPGRDKTRKNYHSDEKFGLISDMRRFARNIIEELLVRHKLAVAIV